MSCTIVPDAFAILVASLTIDFVRAVSAIAAELPLVGQSVVQLERGGASSISFIMANRFVGRRVLVIRVLVENLA